jgi:hypothetical protein
MALLLLKKQPSAENKKLPEIYSMILFLNVLIMFNLIISKKFLFHVIFLNFIESLMFRYGKLSEVSTSDNLKRNPAFWPTRQKKILYKVIFA